jgi:hypothetical protein
MALRCRRRSGRLTLGTKPIGQAAGLTRPGFAAQGTERCESPVGFGPLFYGTECAESGKTG